MLGTDPSSKGGVASVVDVYRRSGLFDRLPIRYVTTHVDGDLFDRVWAAINGMFTVLALLISGQVSIIHAHSSSNGSFMRKSLILSISRPFRVKTIFHLHGSEFRLYYDDAGWLLRHWIKWTLESCTAVIALSESWRAYLHTIAPAANVCVIANPVDLLPESTIHPDEQRLLFLGHVVRRKGIFDIIEAMGLLKLEFPALKLALGGDCEITLLLESARQHGVDGMIDVLGWIGEDAKRAEFARSAVFVMPSYNEGLPIAMLEAMAAGKAIVVTPVGGIPEAVEHEVHGLLVPPGDVAALAQAISQLLHDSGLRKRLGQAARERIKERYATEVVLECLYELYTSLEAGKRYSILNIK